MIKYMTVHVPFMNIQLMIKARIAVACLQVWSG